MIQENRDKLLILTEAAHHILYQEEPRSILDSLFHELSDSLGLDLYFNYHYDKETNRLRLMNYSGIPEFQARQIEWLEMGEAVCGHVAQERRKLIVENIQQSLDPRVSIIKGLGIRTYACSPLLSYGRLIGTLSFGSTTRSAFTADEVELLDTLCSQLAVQLERFYLTTELRANHEKLTANYERSIESERKFRSIFDSALDGILIVNEKHILVEANPAACRTLGITSEDFNRLKLNERLPAVFNSHNPPEAVIRLPDGSERILEYTFTRNVMPGHHMIMLRDITTRKLAVKGLLEAKDQAVKANKAKSEFLSMMNHELRTPLNSILGFTQILLDDTEHPLDSVQRDRINRILKSSRHLTGIINEILSHVQIGNGQLKVKRSKLLLQEAVEESLQLLSPLAQDKRLLTDNRLSRLAPVFVVGDDTRIRQVLLNLLSNAIKYNKPGGSITIDCEILTSYVRLTITDTGIGIADEHLELIFEPFFQIYHPELNIEGTGIGLTLVKNYVSMMGGTVGVQSKLNEGSSFWLTLPTAL